MNKVLVFEERSNVLCKWGRTQVSIVSYMKLPDDYFDNVSFKDSLRSIWPFFDSLRMNWIFDLTSRAQCTIS